MLYTQAFQCFTQPSLDEHRAKQEIRGEQTNVAAATAAPAAAPAAAEGFALLNASLAAAEKTQQAGGAATAIAAPPAVTVTRNIDAPVKPVTRGPKSKMPTDPAEQEQYIQAMADKGVAGLALAVGRYVDHAPGLSADDRKKIFTDNALRAYPRLKSKLPKQAVGAA